MEGDQGWWHGGGWHIEPHEAYRHHHEASTGVEHVTSWCDVIWGVTRDGCVREGQCSVTSKLWKRSKRALTLFADKHPTAASISGIGSDCAVVASECAGRVDAATLQAGSVP